MLDLKIPKEKKNQEQPKDPNTYLNGYLDQK